jgi:hypothetical protein
MKKIIFSMLLLMITSLHAKGQSEPYDYNATSMIVVYIGKGVVYADFQAFFSLKNYINTHATKMKPAKNQGEIDFLLGESHYTFMLINPKQNKLIHIGEGWISDEHYWGVIPDDKDYQYFKHQIIEARVSKSDMNQPNDLKAIDRTIKSFEGYVPRYTEEDYPSQAKQSHHDSANLSASQKSVAHNQAIEERAPIPANTNQSISNASSSYSKTYSSTSTSAFSSFTYSSIEAGRIVSDVPSKNPDNHPETDSNNQPTEQPLVSKPLLLLILGGCLILLIFFLRKKK